MSRFFIDRPVFAWVIAIVIMLAGALSIVRLPVAQYPSIAPPTITVICTYPGASAETLAPTRLMTSLAIVAAIWPQTSRGQPDVKP